ncbi:MBL fold metallo-hydrolase [Numidum massiliense]|uniref:MBL fold metallo-hydrolase n=1 Tax=Numidum massiliense TaxID=1522315 RepID=UPI0006D59A49|nr:ribonuclease Z [Numidum massiliense]
MEITLLGTASAAGSVERDNTYLLLNCAGDYTMVDVGGNPLGKLKQLGICLDDVQRVVLTHFHIDHIYGLPSLLWGMWIHGRTKPLTIYCAAENEARLSEWLHVMGTAEWPVKFAIHIHPFTWQEETVLIAQEDYALSTFPSKHSGPTVGLKCVEKASQKVFVYSSDATPSEWIKAQPHIDLLVHEATTATTDIPVHTNLAQIVQFYPLEHKDRIGQVVLVHLTDGEDYDAILTELEQETKARIQLGHDLMQIDV